MNTLRKLIHRAEWRPQKDLPGDLSLRQHLQQHVEDIGTVAPTSNDMATMFGENDMSVREAVEAASWLQSGADPIYRAELWKDD